MMVGWLVSMTVWWLKNILKNDGVRQWVSDDIPYMKWEIPNSVGKSQLWLVESICSLVKLTHRLVDHVYKYPCLLVKAPFFV
jgi:hypothetical protein